MALLLLMGATLFVRSLRNMLEQNLGLNRNYLLLARVDPLAAGYSGPALETLYQELRANLRSIPGVKDATFSRTSLFGHSDSRDEISLDISVPKTSGRLGSNWTLVGPDYLATLGVLLLRGRDINSSDAAQRATVCVINETFARTYFSQGDPIGRHLTDVGRRATGPASGK